VTVGGYAGTGKTTMISELRKRLAKYSIHLPVAFVTFTGKASSVLHKKLKETNSIYRTDSCGTIHSLIYKAETKWDKKTKTFVITGWIRRDSDEIFEKFIIIDEASMVSRQIWNDLLSYNIPIIAFGDHGQLPPIGDNGFNLMEKPDYVLTKIHRQFKKSPIIKLSKFVRNEGYIPFGFYSPEVFKTSYRHPLTKRILDKKVNFKDDNLITLCGFNTTRCSINNMVRKKLGYKAKAPYPGEKIVCLNNDHSLKIMNGQIGKVIWLMPHDKSYKITLQIDAEIYDCFVADRCFGEVTYTMYDKSDEIKSLRYDAIESGYSSTTFFDYGYCISVHKSQGSEWDKVVLFEQRTPKWDDEYYAKWLYTAITRSRKHLFIIADAWL
jgi:ATP-dependent exoDNAse (exonuclease V) alpha subunit